MHSELLPIWGSPVNAPTVPSLEAYDKEFLKKVEDKIRREVKKRGGKSNFDIVFSPKTFRRLYILAGYPKGNITFWNNLQDAYKAEYKLPVLSVAMLLSLVYRTEAILQERGDKSDYEVKCEIYFAHKGRPWKDGEKAS